jgi:F-box/leucine-rich repeat protein 10/11
MSSDTRWTFGDAVSRPRSPTRPLNAIELIPASRFILSIAEKLAVPPPKHTNQASSHRTQRRKTTKKAAGTASSSRRAAATPKGPRHLHTTSAGTEGDFQRPPYSPIDTLASVAVVANSPNFHNAPIFFSPSGASGQHVQLSPLPTTYPAPNWGTAQYGEYNHGLDERPSKRARSEFLPSPQQGSPVFNQGSTRPATSYNSSFGWSHNVEHSIDSGHRMGGFSPSASSSHYRPVNPVEDQTRMFDDAELLLHFSTRGASASAANGNHKPPELDRRTLKDTSSKTPSIPPFPYRAPERTRHSDHTTVPPPPPEQNHPTVPPPVSETNARRIEDSHAGPSIQTQTPPEDVSVSAPQSEYIVLEAEKPVPLSGIAPSDVEMEDVNPRPSVELHQGTTAGDIREFRTAPPRQLYSPQSLLAEPRDCQIPADPVLPQPTGLLIVGTPVEWSSQPKERRNSESHIPFAPEHSLNNGSVRPSSVPPSNLMDIGPEVTPAAIETNQNHAPPTSLNDQTTRCSGCNWAPNSISEHKVDWLQCDGCQNWYHFACAGFQPRDIRRIDKFYCRSCKGKFGGTTCNS